MEAVYCALGFACLMAFASAFLLGRALFEFRDSTGARMRVVGSLDARTSALLSLLRNGIRALNPLAQALLRVSVVRGFATKIELSLQAVGYATTTQSVITLGVTLQVLVIVLGLFVSSSWVCCLALVLCTVFVANMVSTRVLDKQLIQVRESIPEALQSLKACFQVGYSLPQAVAEVAHSTKGSLGELFSQIDGALTTGGDVEEALRLLKEQQDNPELVFLGAALEIQHKTGSSMQHVLEVASQSVADEMELKRTLRTQTAQAKLSAQVVTIMPFALVGLFSLISPDFLMPFFNSAPGVALLCLALLMQAAGIAMVRKMLKIEVG